MAKIRNSNPKTSSGGYERLLGNKDMADIFTKAQSTVISNGTELEKIITERANNIEDLDDFMSKVNSGQMENGVFLCTKKITKKSAYKLEGHEPDFLIFNISDNGKVAHVIELKDGDAFDTKKSAGEKASLKQFKMHLGSMIEFRTDYKICAFNQSDKEKIVIESIKKEQDVIKNKKIEILNYELTYDTKRVDKNEIVSKLGTMKYNSEITITN